MRDRKPKHAHIQLTITSADIPGTLQAMIARNIPVIFVIRQSDLCVCVEIPSRFRKQTEMLLQKRGEEYQINFAPTPLFSKSRIQSRLVLLSFLLLLILGTMLLPTKVLFIRVAGNQNVHTNRILEIASSAGLTFWSQRSTLDIGRIKNEILENIPNISWVGITTNGCVAEIWVVELETSIREENASTYNNIIASTDGVIQSVTVTKGIPYCQPGQAVRAGQLLISGYQDLGLLIRAGNAEGEVIAQTYHKTQTVMPVSYASMETHTENNQKISLIIGKKQINFYKGSGISPIGCVKIKLVYYLTLPGGWTLPIGILLEQWIAYEPSAETVAFDPVTFTTNYAEQYVQSQMTGGSILSASQQSITTDDLIIVHSSFVCTEQIGKTHIEEIHISDG